MLLKGNAKFEKYQNIKVSELQHCVEAMDDLDDLLDDIDIDDLDGVNALSLKDDILNAAAAEVLSPDVGDNFGDDLQNEMDDIEFKSWNDAISKLSPALKERWTKMVKADNQAYPISKKRIQPSYSYKEWEKQKATKVPHVSKVLQDMIGKAGSKCKFDEAKMARLRTMCDPLKSEAGRELVEQFGIQLIKDSKSTIEDNCNYNATQFPGLTTVMNSA